MRKLIVAFTLFSYFSLSHYCLAYALLTGHAHHPPELASLESKPAMDDHHDAHEHCPGHKQGNKDKSDPCCATFSCEVPALLPGSNISVVSGSIVSFPVVLSVDVRQEVNLESFLAYSTGPPGSYQDVHFSPRTSRAPPSTVSL